MCELRQRRTSAVYASNTASLCVLRYFVEGCTTRGAGLARFREAPEAAVRHDRALERRLRLEADDHLVVLVDVARRVRGDRARDLGHVENALLALLDEQPFERLPDLLRSSGRRREKRLVAVVRRVVDLDEVADVDLA